MDTTNRITIVAEVGAVTGWTLHCNELFHWLTKLGFFVSIRPLRVRRDFGITPPVELQARLVQAVQPEPWEILLASPHKHRPTPGKKTIFYTMYESTELPGASVSNINQADVVVVPCQWCKYTFKASGVNKPIYVIPLGIDPEIFSYQPLPESEITIFGAAGRTSHGKDRKGLDEVVRAFKFAFPYEPNVRLQIKLQPDDEPPRLGDDRISIIPEHMTAKGVAHWLSKIHCFVSAAKGEGWGLWQQQSQAVGRPVVAACYGGLQEFMGPENSYPVRYKEMACVGNHSGKWAWPDLGHMIEQMRFVHDHHEDVASRGELASKAAHRYTWQRMGEQMVTLMGEVGIAPKINTPVKTYPWILHSDYSSFSAPSIEDQCAERGWPLEQIKVKTTPNQVVFNPTVADWNGERIWMGRRSTVKDGCRIHSKLIVFNEQGEELREIVMTGFDGDAYEDPRITATTPEKLFVSYTRVAVGKYPCQEMIMLDRDYKVIGQWHVNYGKNGMSSKSSTGAEKNWVWFKEGTDWHCIYWLEPMKVFKAENGRITRVYETNQHYKGWKWGIRHGGATPVRIGDEWFGWCHSLMPWFAKDRSRYFISNYAFSAKPPFQMTRLSKVPLLASEDDWAACPCSCIIAGGAILESDQWIVALGAKDEACYKWTVPHQDVLENMVTL